MANNTDLYSKLDNEDKEWIAKQQFNMSSTARAGLGPYEGAAEDKSWVARVDKELRDQARADLAHYAKPPKDQTVTLACDFLGQVGLMLVEKNARYGNAAADPLRVFSRSPAEEQLLVRIDDKLSRIARGNGIETEDVIRDLVGYLALLWAVRQ